MGSLRLGSAAALTKAYLGSSSVNRIYLGSEILLGSTEPPPGPGDPGILNSITDKMYWVRAEDIVGGPGTTFTSVNNRAGKKLLLRGASNPNSLQISSAQTPLGKKSIKSGNSKFFFLPNPYDQSPLKEVVVSWEGVGGEEGWRVADGNVNTSWYTNQQGNSPQWVRYELSTPKVVKSYSLAARNGYLGRSPKTWQFRGSNDGTQWDVLDSRTNVTDWVGNTKKTYALANTNAYLFYSVYITAIYEGAEINISTFELVDDAGLIIPRYNATSCEFWAVLRSDPVDNGHVVQLSPQGNVSHYTYGGTHYTNFGTNARYAYGVSGYSMQQFHLLHMKQTPTQQIIRVNNITQGTTNTPFAYTDFSRLFNGAWEGEGFSYAGDTAEVFGLSRNATDAERNTIETYLNYQHFTAPPP